MMLGQIDEVDGHYVATKFAALSIPTGSMYITAESYSRRGNVSTHTWEGVPIKLQWKSALLAYPRVWFPFLAIAWPFLMHWGQNISATTTSTWLTSGAFIVASALSHLPGRLSDATKARLRLLGTVSGMRLDPAKLPPYTREHKRDFFAELMVKGGLPTAPDAIVAVLEDIPTPALPLVYAFARYSGDDPTWRECAALVYAHHERSEVV